jgi:SPP1 family predicted phage head-tail adaptor
VSAAFDPGRLRHRVVLEEAVATPDGAGGESLAWQAAATLWGSIRPVKDGERTAAGHLAGVVTHRVAMRRRDDVTGAKRLTHRGRAFRILAVRDPDEARRFIEVLCEEEAP